MNPSEWLSAPLFSLFDKNFTLAQLLGTVAGLAVAVYFYRAVLKNWLPRATVRLGISPTERSQLKGDLLIAFCLLLPAILIKTGNIPDEIRLSDVASVGLSEILFLLGFVQVARFADHFISAVLPGFFVQNTEIFQKTRLVRFIAWTIGGLWLVQRTGRDQVLFTLGDRGFRVSNIFAALLVFFSAQLALFLLRRFALSRIFHRENLDQGTQFSINRLFSFIVYVLAALLIFQSLGIEMTVVWGSMAAVLVGAGLGLRETVNDFISGVILLFEKTVRVGDFIEVQGQSGLVKRIGFRTSLVETRDHTTVVVPNSKLFSDKVINFRGEDAIARFHVSLRVGFDTDLETVRKLMLAAAREQDGINQEPPPKMRVTGFFDHGIEVELLFFVRDFESVDDLKSALRENILAKMRELDVRVGYDGGGTVL